jgi:hypothetical protein
MSGKEIERIIVFDKVFFQYDLVFLSKRQISGAHLSFRRSFNSFKRIIFYIVPFGKLSVHSGNDIN